MWCSCLMGRPTHFLIRNLSSSSSKCSRTVLSMVRTVCVCVCVCMCACASMCPAYVYVVSVTFFNFNFIVLKVNDGGGLCVITCNLLLYFQFLNLRDHVVCSGINVSTSTHNYGAWLVYNSNF